MTLYLGETILLSHTATFDGEDLTDSNTESVDIIIYNADEEEVVTSTPMIWNATDSRWEYWWDTDNVDLTSGRYTCKVTVTTTNGVNWEYFKVALKANPIS